MAYTQYKGWRTKPKMKGVWVHDANGSEIKIKIRKNIPMGCKTPKLICIKCQKIVIPKLSKRYESKICEDCTLNKS